jgi:lysophospholipase L1-like esterase
MRQTRTTLLLALVALFAAGAAFAQPDLSKYVALGDSLTAGYSGGGLTKMYQDNSYPALLAKQFGITNFQQPTVSDPGIPAVLMLQSLAVVSGSVVPTIVPKPGQGSPLPASLALATPYNNLGIPGAATNDLLTKTGDVNRLLAGQSTSATVMYDLILRDKTNTAIMQGIGLAGTFYTVWIGNNDVLGAVLSGVAVDGVTLTPAATFQTQYTSLLGALHQSLPNAKIVVATVPDVGAIAFATTVKPYVYLPTGQKLYLYGEAGQLTDSDLVTLQASSLISAGYGLSPAKPLPEGSIDATGLHAGVILRAAEITLIRNRTNDINTIIKSVASSIGAKVVDVNAIFNDILVNGRVVGGVTLTGAFLTGGLFGYDGVHPQTLGYAVLTNEFIKVINSGFGANVPLVNLQPFLLGTTAMTTVQAADFVFSLDAYKSVLATLVPTALTDKLETPRTVHQHIRPAVEDTAAQPEP